MATYAEIRDLQSRSNPWLQSLSPADFSRVMGQITGAPQEYASGVDPSWLAQADYAINQGLEATGLPEAAAQLGEAGFGATGRQVFHGVPRAIVNMAPLAVPGPGWVGALGMGALAGLETYGATEKPLPSLMSAGLAAATPAIMGKAGGAAIRAMKGPEDAAQAATLRAMMAEGTPVAANIAAHTTEATTPGQVLARLGAGQAALTGAQTGVEAINIWADPDRHFSELIAPENLAAQALSQAVFGGLDVARLPGQLRQANRMKGLLTTPDKGFTLGPTSPLQQETRPPVQGPEYGPQPDMRLAEYVGNLARSEPTAEPMAEVAPPIVAPPVEPLVIPEVGPVSAGEAPLRMPVAEREAKLNGTPVEQAEAVKDVLLPTQLSALEAVKEQGIKDGKSPEEATLEAVNMGRAAVQDALEPAQANLSKIEQQNLATLTERTELAKESPAVQAEVDLVLDKSRWFADNDKNMGSGRTADPAWSAYRKWLLDGSPGELPGLAKKLDASVKAAAKPRPKEQLKVELNEARFVADDGAAADMAAEESRGTQPPVEQGEPTYESASTSETPVVGLPPGKTRKVQFMREPGEEKPKSQAASNIAQQVEEALSSKKDLEVRVVRSGKYGETPLAFRVEQHPDPNIDKPSFSVTALRDKFGNSNFDANINKNFDSKEQFIAALKRYQAKETTRDVQPLRDPLAIGEEMAALATDPSPEAKARLDQLSLERANATPDEKIGHAGTFFGKAMRMMGMSEQEIATRLPGIARLWTSVKELAGTDLAQLTSKGRQAYGLFVAGGHPLVMMSAEPRSSKLLAYTTAHELIGHGLWDAHARGVLDPKVSMQLDRTRKFVAGALPEDRALMLKWMTEGLPRDLQKSPELAAILSSAETVQSADEVMAHMNALAAIHMVEGKTSNLSGLVKYLPKPLSDFLVNAASWASKSMRALKMAFRGNKEMWDVLAGHEEAMRDVMRAGRETEADALRFKAFAQMQEPGGIMDIAKDHGSAGDWFSDVFDTSELAGFGDQTAKWMMGPEMVRDIGAEAKAAGAGLLGAGRTLPQALVHMFRGIPQIGAAKKEFRYAADIMGRATRGIARTQRMLSDVLSGKHVGGSALFLPDTPLAKVNNSNRATIDAKNNIHRWVNEFDKSKTAYEHVVAGTPEVMAEFNKIPAAQQNDVKALLAQQDQVARKGTQDRFETAIDLAAANAAGVSIKGADVRYEAASSFFNKYGEQAKAGQPIDYATMTAEAVPVFTGNDPALAQQRALRAVEMFKTQVEMAQERTAFNQANIGYISERRMGDYRITYINPDGETDMLGFSNKADADKMVKTLEREGSKNITVHDKAQQGLKTFPEESVSDYELAFGEITARQKLKLQQLGVPDAEIDGMLEAVDVRPELSNIAAQKDIASTHIKAKRTHGRRHLDMTEQQWEWEQAVNRRGKRAIAEAEMRGVENDSQLAGTPEARSLATAFTNFKTPDSPTMRRISKFGYFSSLAFNSANMFMEAVQPVVAFPWKLVDEGAGPIAAHGHIQNGYRQMLKAMSSAKYLKDGQFDMSKLSADHQKVISEAMANGTIEAQGFTEFEEGGISDVFRKGSVTMGNLDPKALEPLAKVAQAAGRLAIRVHNKFTNLSTGVALLASYDFYRAKGLDHTAAMRATYPLVNEGMLRGGREARAAGIYDVGAARPVASMMMSLQGFSIGTLTQMATYLSRGVKGGLAPGERGNSWKAAAGMIASQVALAGVMGLPGVGAGLRILQKTTGFDLEKWLESLAAVGDDPSTEAMVKTMAMRGFSHALGGPDVSQRFGVSSVLGFNDFNGFDLASLFGPVGSYAKRGAGAVGDLARGDVAAAAEAVAPVAARKTLQLWRDDWTFRSPENDELLIKDPSLGEKVSFALGWQPVKLNRARQVWAMQRRAREAQVAEEKRTFDEVADDWMEGDMGAVQKVLSERAQARGPAYGARERKDDADKIAERVEKRTFPRDPGKEGTQASGPADEALLKAMGVYAPTQEAARAQLRDQVYRQLGLQGYDNSDLEKYRQVDVLRKRNPFLTTAGAASVLRGQRGGGQRAVPPAMQALLPVQ